MNPTRNAASKILTVMAVLILGVLANSPARAQVDIEPGVARVSLIHGDVSMQRGDSGELSAVTLNTPLVAGDRISTGERSRTGVQLDFANILRLDEYAQANIATLTRTQIQIQMAQGLANLSVLKGSEADVEIDTPNVAVRPLREGRYRIEVHSNRDTEITIREGEAEISTPEGSTIVKKGNLITIRGTGNEVQYQTSKAPSNDSWDDWNKDRDRIVSRAQSWRYTNRYYTGAGDLDAYGRWSNIPDYGAVWIPRVHVGWAPYRSGRWVWQSYYGWTWVSSEPWGWAPYHYGRWLVHHGAWVWWPGPVHSRYRPVWAPAYVSFFGFGKGVSVGVSIGFGGGYGSIGWIPIGPGDYYHPWYGAHRNRFSVVNVTNIYNIRGSFAPLRPGRRFSNLQHVLVNKRLRHGISTVAAERFGRGGFRSRAVSAAELREGRVMTANLPVVPSRESLRVSDRNISRSASSRFIERNRFFSKRTPSRKPQRFSEQAAEVRQAMERNGGFRAANNAAAPNVRNNIRNGDRPRGTRVAGNLETRTQGGSSRARSFPTQRQQGNSGGWRRFGSNRQGPSASGGADRQGRNSRSVRPLPNRSQAENLGRARANERRQPIQGRRTQGGWRTLSGRPDTPASEPQQGENRNRTRGSARRSQPNNRQPLDLNRPIVRARPDGGSAERGNRTSRSNERRPAARSRPSGKDRGASARSAPNVRSAPKSNPRNARGNRSEPKASPRAAPSNRSKSNTGKRPGFSTGRSRSDR